MNKRHVLGVILVLFLLTDLSAYSGGQRRDWWKIRQQNLRTELAMLERNPSIDPAVRDLVRDDIARAEVVIGMFDRAPGDGKGPGGKNAMMTADDARTLSAKISGAVFSACLLEYLTASAGHRENYRAVKEAAGNEINRMMKSSIGAADDELHDTIITADISRVEWQYCTLEAFFSAVIRSEGALRARVIAAGENAARDTDPGYSPAELRRLIMETALAECSALINPTSIAIAPPDLASSPSWQSVRARIGARLSRMRELREMADTGGEFVAPTGLRDLLDDPAGTERLIFSRAALRYFDRRNIDPAAGREPSGAGTFIRIPKNVDGTLLFRDLDEARRAAAASVKGGEDPAFFAATEKNLSAIVERYTAETGAGFIAGDERLRRIKDDGMTGEVANEKEFLQAKAVYADRMSLVRGYVLRSMRFLRWLSSGKGLDGDAIVASLKARAAANREYLAFADKLAAGGEALSSLGSPVLKRRYALAARNIESLHRAAANSMSLDKNAPRFLTPSRYAEARAIRAEFNELIKSSRAANAARLAAFSRNVAVSAKNESKKAGAPDAETAAFEIEQMMKRVESYHGLYSRLGYTAGALARYAKLYGDMDAALARGEKPEGLDDVIAKKTLLGLVDGFDPAAIRAERATASHLQRETAAEIARVVTLVKHYRQRGIEPRDHPSMRGLSEIKKSLGDSPSVMVGSWTMNGTNVEEVDRKLAHRLAGAYHRMVWKAKRPGTVANAGAPPQNGGPGKNSSPLIPAGWMENEAADDDANAGIIRRFTSSDKSASITIARVQAGGRMLNEISARWAKERGAGIVKQRWGRRENTDYFWTLARSPGRKVLEVYVLDGDEGPIVVSGSAPRDRYTAFKAHLDAVFESMAR